MKVHCDAGCERGQLIEFISMTVEGMAEDAGIDGTPIPRAGTTAMAAFYVNGLPYTAYFAFQAVRRTSTALTLEMRKPCRLTCMTSDT